MPEPTKKVPLPGPPGLTESPKCSDGLTFTPCCGYAVRQRETGPIYWNPYSRAVQCHACGQVYRSTSEGAAQVDQETLTPEWVFDLPPGEDLRQSVMAAIGAATGCWEKLEGAGFFLTERAEEIGQKLWTRIAERLELAAKGGIFIPERSFAERIEKAARMIIVGFASAANKRNQAVVEEACRIIMREIAGMEPLSRETRTAAGPPDVASARETPPLNPGTIAAGALSGAPKDFRPMDADIELALSVHRVIRSLHDGVCPRCGVVHPCPEVGIDEQGEYTEERCSACGFTITVEEQKAGLALFAPVMRANLEVFEGWRSSRNTNQVTPKPENYR